MAEIEFVVDLGFNLIDAFLGDIVFQKQCANSAGFEGTVPEPSQTSKTKWFYVCSFTNIAFCRVLGLSSWHGVLCTWALEPITKLFAVFSGRETLQASQIFAETETAENSHTLAYHLGE